MIPVARDDAAFNPDELLSKLVASPSRPNRIEPGVPRAHASPSP
jgi:hypothetical protein